MIRKALQNKGQLGTDKSLVVDLLGWLQSGLCRNQPHGCARSHRCVCTAGIRSSQVHIKCIIVFSFSPTKEATYQ